jgi:hypothetical protein
MIIIDIHSLINLNAVVIDLQTFPIVAKLMMIDFIAENNKCAHEYLEIIN